MATIEVVGISGQTIVQPVTLEASACVSDIKELVHRELQGPRYRIKLLHEHLRLPDCGLVLEVLGDGQSQVWLLTAVLEPPLTEESRAEYLRMVRETFALEKFRQFPEEARGDVDVVRAFIERDGRCFELAHPSMRENREVVLTAVRKSRTALAVAHKAFRKDREVMLKAATHFGNALQYSDESLMLDKQFLTQIVKGNGAALEYVHAAFKEDRAVVKAAVQHNGMALEFVGSDMQADRELAMEAVRQTGFALKHVSRSLHEDKEIVEWAVRSAGKNAVKLIQSHLKNDPEVLNLAISANVGWRR